MGDFFDVFLFEEQPAKNRSAQAVYLDEVASCDVYLGLFGSKYGSRDSDGVSPTEREYDHATELHKKRAQEAGQSKGLVGTQSAPSRHPVTAPSRGTQSRHPVCHEGERAIHERVIALCEVPRSTKELLDEVGRSDRTKFKRFVLRALMEDGILEWTIPDKPNSRLQKYRLTNKGRALAATLTR